MKHNRSIETTSKITYNLYLSFAKGSLFCLEKEVGSFVLIRILNLTKDVKYVTSLKFFVAGLIPPDAFLTLMSVNKVAADRGIKFALKI